MLRSGGDDILHSVSVSADSKAAYLSHQQSGLLLADPSLCTTVHDREAFTPHNATVMHDLARVTWYAGGLQAVDVSDPAHPVQLAELRPEPVAA